MNQVREYIDTPSRPTSSSISLGSQCIQMPALGRPFTLGQLYDCRSDSIITGLTLWSYGASQVNIETEDRESIEFEYFEGSGLNTKAKALDIGGGLSLSLLSNLLEVGGSGKFFKMKESTEKCETVTLRCRCLTKFQSLSMDHLSESNIEYKEVFDKNVATHVVTGIQYGAQVFLEFEESKSHIDKSNVREGRLLAKVKQIGPEFHASHKPSTDEEFKHVSCQLFSDLMPESNPTTFMEAKEYCKNFPKILKDSPQRAVPLIVWLTPLHILSDAASAIVREIDASLVDTAKSILEHLVTTDKQLSQLLKSRWCKRYICLRKEIICVQAFLQKYENQLKADLKMILPSVRANQESDNLLYDLICKHENSPFSSSIIDTWLDQREKEINHLDEFTNEMRNVTFRNDRLHLPGNSVFIALLLTRPSQPEHTLMQEMSELCSFQRTGSTGKEGKSSKGNSLLRSHLKHDTSDTFFAMCDSFRSCVLANNDNLKVSFLVLYEERDIKVRQMSVTREASIVIHVGGKWKPFSPPEQPIGLAIEKASHNKFSISWKSSDGGSIEKYEVHCTSVQSDGRRCGEVKFADNSSAKIKGLKEACSYTVKVRGFIAHSIRTPYSDDIRVTTHGTSPPEDLNAWQTHKGMIFLQWAAPHTIASEIEIYAYKIEYSTDSKIWHGLKAVQDTYCEIPAKHPGMYFFRVCAISRHGYHGHSAFSKPCKIQVSEHAQTALKDVLRAESETKVKGDKYEICTFSQYFKSDKEKKIMKYWINTNPQQSTRQNIPEKVILVVGATGTGKSTLINFLFNYITGIEWDDKFRFKLIEERSIVQPGSKQAISDTIWVTSYTLIHDYGSKVPYTVTIIDTPGFCDTSGIETDKKITEQIQNLFACQDKDVGIPHLDAVAMVVQASASRLNAPQQYIFDSVLSLFGKDIKENIFIFVTFADPSRPEALKAIKDADIEYRACYLFNNIALYQNNICTNADDSSIDGIDEECVDMMLKGYWNMGMKNCDKFFAELHTLPSKSLSLTKDVTKYRHHLELSIQNLNKLIEVGLEKLEELHQTQKVFQENRRAIDENRNFEFTVVEIEKRKVPGKRSTNCSKCQETCHEDCWVKFNPFVRFCFTFGWGRQCQSCKCRVQEHCSERFIYETFRVSRIQTTEKVKKKYEEALGAQMNTEQLLQRMGDEVYVAETQIIELVQDIRKALDELAKVALKPHSSLTVDYIELLIENEKQEKKAGWKERLRGLEIVRKKAVIMQDLVNKGYDPFKEYKEKLKQLREDTRTEQTTVLGTIKDKLWNQVSDWYSAAGGFGDFTII